LLIHELSETEIFWRDHYDWLKEHGYQLRPRYQPNWVPSWRSDPTKLSMDYEDNLIPKDGKPVILRRPDPPSVSQEIQIGRIVSSAQQCSDLRNHCVPIDETLLVSDTEEPRNHYFSDAKDTNIMMDWSPFTIPNDGPHLLRPGYGGDRTVPEFSRNEQCDPFKVDVYCLGNLIRTKFLTGDRFSVAKGNLEFLQGLISDMTHDDPSKRPNMEQVVSRFDEIRKGLSSRKLRSRIFNKDEHFIQQCLIFPFHWLRQASYVARRLPAIPRYTARDVHKE
ncbi:hypothetical protein BT96DRAFT_924531, partial [Gymnopus androsaceus JB14]